MKKSKKTVQPPYQPTSCSAHRRESDEKVEVPNETNVASLDMMGREKFSSERVIPQLPKLDRLPIPRERNVAGSPPSQPSIDEDKEEVSAAPWLEGKTLAKMPNIRDLTKEQLGEGGSPSRGREGG